MMALRTSRSSVRFERRFRPQLEGLEARDCPTTGVTSSINTPPSVELFVNYIEGKQISLHGFVRDENPGTATLHFSGSYSGMVTPAEDGSFCVITDQASLGTVYASAVDEGALGSSQVSVQISTLVPVISSFNAIHVAGNTWTFSGSVADEFAEGLSVYFGGLASLQNKTATVDANGQFSLTVELTNGEEGTATAWTLDWWGMQSEVAEVLVNPSV